MRLQASKIGTTRGPFGWLGHLERLDQARTAYIYLSPVFCLLAMLIAYPVGYAVYLSVSDFVPGAAGMVMRFAGLKHYAQIARDPIFLQVLGQTVYFTVVRVLLTMLLGLVMAMVLNVRSLGSKVFRHVFLIPWALSHVVNALMWKWMYNADYGVLNEILVRLALIDKYQSWLSQPATAMHAVIFADVWKNVPFVTLMLLAALQNVRRELYEAAMVDGAGSVRCFFHVTLPSIRPVLLVTLVLQTMWAVKTFDLIWVLTQGGPVDSTLILNVYAYQQAFTYLNLNYGAALSIVVATIILALTLVYAWGLGREEAET